MKIKELQANLKKKKLDGIILFSKDPNFFYFVQQNMDDAFLFVPSKGGSVLFTSSLEDAKTSIKKIVYCNPFEDLKKYFTKKRVKIIGINESNLIVKQKKRLLKLAKTKNIDNILINLRKTKTKEETSKIKKACVLTEKVISKIVRNSNFKTEDDIKKLIKIEAIKYGCELSFEPIVASGKNACIPHYFGNQKIGKGFLIVDLGLKYEGYCADITRTFYVGKPSNKDLGMYDTLLNIQKKAIDMIRPGIKVKKIEDFVRKELGMLEKYFSHSLGHGLGIKVHEQPRVSINSNDVLREGMVITIEPGYYKHIGIRIEDDVLVTGDGYEILSKFSKKLIIIPKV